MDKTNENSGYGVENSPNQRLDSDPIEERKYSRKEVDKLLNSFESLCAKYQSNKDWFPAKKQEWFEQNLKP